MLNIDELMRAEAEEVYHEIGRTLGDALPVVDHSGRLLALILGDTAVRVLVEDAGGKGGLLE